jgi:hypothetical protein
MLLCMANTAADLAKFVFKHPGPVTQRLKQLAADANNDQLSVIPSKYWKFVRSLPEVCKELCLFTVYLP